MARPRQLRSRRRRGGAARRLLGSRLRPRVDGGVDRGGGHPPRQLVCRLRRQGGDVPGRGDPLRRAAPAALATNKTGLDGVQHVLDTVVRLTVRDPQRRGCLILNAIPEAAAMSAETREQLDAALQSMRALLRARLREAQRRRYGRWSISNRWSRLLFAASVAIRVLGRAGHDRQFLQQIATARSKRLEAAWRAGRSDQCLSTTGSGAPSLTRARALRGRERPRPRADHEHVLERRGDALQSPVLCDRRDHPVGPRLHRHEQGIGRPPRPARRHRSGALHR